MKTERNSEKKGNMRKGRETEGKRDRETEKQRNRETERETEKQ